MADTNPTAESIGQKLGVVIAMLATGHAKLHGGKPADYLDAVADYILDRFPVEHPVAFADLLDACA